jgi:hypothetical protein
MTLKYVLNVFPASRIESALILSHAMYLFGKFMFVSRLIDSVSLENIYISSKRRGKHFWNLIVIMTCSDTLQRKGFLADQPCDNENTKYNHVSSSSSSSRNQNCQGFTSSLQPPDDLDTESPRSKASRNIYVRRVACKARGLSKNHNSETAYFEVPPNAPHGMLLSCSHPECVASGRKFRYCQCKFIAINDELIT